MRISDWSSDVCSSDLLTTWDIPHTGGSTNYNAALDAVFSGNGDYLSNDNPITGLPNAVNRLFFLSDGEVNEGGNEIENDNDNKSEIQSNRDRKSTRLNTSH